MDEPQPLEDLVLATKLLVPRVPRALVARPRLHALLRQGLARQLTVVAAPAGFGKTTLLASLVESSRQPDSSFITHPSSFAWVSLDQADNNPTRFWRHVFAALERQLPGVAGAALAAIARDAPPSDALAALINALAALEGRCALVLDDYHLISAPQIHAALGFLLDHQPPQLHLIIATRATPPLPLARLRASAAVCELGEAQLRCTADEATAFLRDVMGLQLPAGTLSTIAERTEGWLVGLQLIGLWLQQRADTDQLLDELRGSHRYILDYVTEQVLDQQPAAVRRFLLHTALLDQLSAELCAAVVGNLTLPGAQELLETLEQRSLFVVALDGQRRWYRYHALFAEALRHRLAQDDAALVPLLHGRASRWYAARDRRYEAIQHALLAQEWAWAADLAADALRLDFSRPGETTIVLGWIAQLPLDVVVARLPLAKAYGSMLTWAGHYGKVERWLLEVVAALGQHADAPEPGERERLLGWSVACRAYVAVMQSQLGPAEELIAQAQRHLARPGLPEHSMLIVAQAWLAHAQGELELANQQFRAALAVQRQHSQPGMYLGTLSVISRNLQTQGQLAEAWRLGQESVDLALQSGSQRSALVGFGYAVQAMVLYERNQLDAARALATQAEALAAASGMEALAMQASFALVAIGLAQGDLAEADGVLAAIERSRSYAEGPLLVRHEMGIWQARLNLARGELAHPAAWAAANGEPARQLTPAAVDRVDTARAQVAVALRRPAEALALLDELLPRSRRQGRLGHVIEQLVLQSLAADQQQREGPALATLAEALELGAPEGHIRSFVDAGPALAPLLERLPPAAHRDRVLAAFAGERQRPSIQRQEPGRRNGSLTHPALVEPLTEREREVLGLLAQGATNQAIAAALFVAPSTVKNHLSHIFGKLEAGNRTQAVARARALGLLDEPA